jgi:hypothetical protein
MSTSKWKSVLSLVLLQLLLGGTALANTFAEALATTNDALMYASESYGDVDVLLAKMQRLRHASDLGGDDQRLLVGLADQLEPLVQQVRAGGDVPWSTAGELARSVRDLVRASEGSAAADQGVALEFLLTQYLYRSFFGVFELAPEQQDSMVSKNEKELLQGLQGQVGIPKEVRQASAWHCLERAVANLEADAKEVNLTPLVFFKCTRNLTE